MWTRGLGFAFGCFLDVDEMEIFTQYIHKLKKLRRTAVLFASKEGVVALLILLIERWALCLRHFSAVKSTIIDY